MVNPGKSERYCREEWGVGGWGGREDLASLGSSPAGQGRGGPESARPW